MSIIKQKIEVYMTKTMVCRFTLYMSKMTYLQTLIKNCNFLKFVYKILICCIKVFASFVTAKIVLGLLKNNLQ